jgi:acyl-CoA reductase-like NAD-dependent aldehyde dehydrogenase
MIRTVSPVDGKIVVEVKCHSEQDLDATLATATKAFQAHRRTPLSTRIEIASKFLDLLDKHKDTLV